MLKKQTYILVLGLTTSLFSCSEVTSESDVATDLQETIDEAKDETETAVEGEQKESTPETDEAKEEGEEISSRYNYDKDWEYFKMAVINKDVKTVSGFISSDNVDAETVIQAFSDPVFRADLKKATYKDLEVDTSGEDVRLVFSTQVEGHDEEGNTYESGLFLYFEQGDPSLLLEDFLAAG